MHNIISARMKTGWLTKNTFQNNRLLYWIPRAQRRRR